MPKILVIADDLTGAAEIGGIAYEAGLSVRIILDFMTRENFVEDVIIIDTNSRHLSEQQAHLKIKTILQTLYLPEFNLVFKKIDSVLRGNIVSEIKAFFSQTFYDSALIIPANPSKKRFIKNGKYFIENVPIGETDFRFDPEYPRKWNTIRKLITNNTIDVITGNIPPKNWNGKFFIPNISSLEDIEKHVSQTDKSEVLFVGGADFFRLMLSKKMACRVYDSFISTDIEFSVQKSFIIGSNSESSLKTQSLLSEKKYPVFHLPTSALTSENQLLNWINKVVTEFKKGGNIAITTPTKFVRNNSQRTKITRILVETAAQIISYPANSNLFFVEGGETASSLFRNLGWQELIVHANFDGGIVMLQHEKTNRKVVLKPGSYKWPEIITKNL